MERVMRDAQALPMILDYLAAHPAQYVTFSRGPSGLQWVALLDRHLVQLDAVALPTDDPGAVVLAALANWTQANRG